MGEPLTSASQRTDRPRGAAGIVLALGPFALGYFLSYTFRSVNAVAAPNLVRDVGVTAGELGLLTAAYLLAFALFQLPLGVLLDRHGPRIVQAALLVVAALGSFLFAAGTDALTLTLARGLIGLGFAGALMSGFKAVVEWLPEDRRAFGNACVMAFGALGVIAATVPAEVAIGMFGWRAVFVGLGVATLVTSALVMLLVPRRARPPTPSSETVSGQFAAALRIYRSRTFLILVPFVATTNGTGLAIQSLWSGPWLRDVLGFDRDGVAAALLAMGVAFLVGTLLSGVVADRLARRGIHILTVMLGFLAVSLASQLVLVLQWTQAALLAWVLLGMTSQSGILSYAWLSSRFGAAYSGRTNTAINLMIFLFAFAVQFGVGAIIDLFDVAADASYDPFAYQVAFAVFLGIQLAALVWYFAGHAALHRPEPA
jgi:predicted MFS family arabinose efflux permease